MSHPISIFLPDDPPPRKKRSPVQRLLAWGFIVGFAAVVGAEGAASWCHKKSEERLREYCRAHLDGPFPTPAEVRQNLAGWALEKETTIGGNHMIVYRWPSLIRTHKLRAILSQANEVKSLDWISAEDDDIQFAIAVAGEHGLVANELTAGNAPGAPRGSPPAERAEALVKVRETLSQPFTSYRSGVVVFPVADRENRILSGGAGLSVIANYSLICSPEKRTTLDPRHIREVLVEGTCWRDRTELVPRRMEACLAEIGTPLHVVPRLETTDAGLQLIVEFRDLSGNRRAKKFEHLVPPQDFARIPGLIALDVLGHLGVDLRPEERDWVAAPQIQGVEDATELSERLAGVPRQVRDRKSFDQFLQRNPECVPAWDVSLAGDMGVAQTQLRPPADSKVLLCSSIQRTWVYFRSGAFDPMKPVDRLLELAPSQRGDPRWYQSLAMSISSIPGSHRQTHRGASKFDNDDALGELFTAWERDGIDYPNQVALGRSLIDWAWRAHGNGYADSVTEEGARLFEERLLRAKKHLENALTLNPAGWQAHRELITVATGLELPFESMDSHFQSARSIAPGDQAIYLNKQSWIKTNWQRATARVLHFARECVESGEWKSGIPQMVPEVLVEGMSDWEKNEDNFANCRSTDFWAALDAYYAGAQSQDDESLRRRALNEFAHWGATSAHFAEVAEAFRRLDVERVEEARSGGPGKIVSRVVTEYNSKEFGPPEHHYAHLRERVLAATDEANAGRLAAIRVALADARLRDAEDELARVTPTDEAESSEIERCRRALALGQRLYRDGKVELAPQEALETFAEYERVSCRGGLDRSPWWKVDGDKLTWDYPGYKHDRPEREYVPCQTAFFPVGVRQAVISGQIEATGDWHYFETEFHAQALTAVVQVVYAHRDHKVYLASRYPGPDAVPLPAGPCIFEIRSGHATDRMFPVPGVQWERNVVDDVPSTFGFVLYPDAEPQSLSISRLKIAIVH